MRVRFATGIVVDYPKARHASVSPRGDFRLYEDADDRNWVATVLANTPCVIDDGTDDVTTYNLSTYPVAVAARLEGKK